MNRNDAYRFDSLMWTISQCANTLRKGCEELMGTGPAFD